MRCKDILQWVLAQLTAPDMSDTLERDEDSLRACKLREEIAQLRRPWWMRTFSWATVLGIGTLITITASGLLNASRLQLSAARERLQYDVEKLREQRELQEISVSRFDAISKICDTGGGVEVWWRPKEPLSFSVRIPRPDVYEGLFGAASGVGLVNYSQELANSVISLKEVEQLDIQLQTGTDRQLAEIVRELTSLEYLTIQCSNTGFDLLVDAILQCPELRLLQLRAYDVDLDINDLRRLQGLQHLESLSLAGITSIDDAVAHALLHFPSLRELDLTGTQVTHESARRLYEKGIFVKDRNGEFLDESTIRERTVPQLRQPD